MLPSRVRSLTLKDVDAVTRVVGDPERVAVTVALTVAADSPEEAAVACLSALSDPELGKRLGRAGKEYVRTHFLMPRLLRDWLRIFTDLA